MTNIEKKSKKGNIKGYYQKIHEPSYVNIKGAAYDTVRSRKNSKVKKHQENKTVILIHRVYKNVYMN